MRRGTAGSCREQALSEVIGFVLIIGIIMVAFSLYLVYGVPVQGRENEINHMSAINDQFVSYKIGIDSLVTNQQTGLSKRPPSRLAPPARLRREAPVSFRSDSQSGQAEHS